MKVGRKRRKGKEFVKWKDDDDDGRKGKGKEGRGEKGGEVNEDVKSYFFR